MAYINLGHAGLKVSRLCLGTLTYGDLSRRRQVLAGSIVDLHLKPAPEDCAYLE